MDLNLNSRIKPGCGWPTCYPHRYTWKSCFLGTITLGHVTSSHSSAQSVKSAVQTRSRRMSARPSGAPHDPRRAAAATPSPAHPCPSASTSGLPLAERSGSASRPRDQSLRRTIRLQPGRAGKSAAFRRAFVLEARGRRPGGSDRINSVALRRAGAKNGAVRRAGRRLPAANQPDTAAAALPTTTIDRSLPRSLRPH